MGTGPTEDNAPTEDATDDLDVPAVDADAVTGGLAWAGKDDEALPENECKG